MHPRNLVTADFKCLYGVAGRNYYLSGGAESSLPTHASCGFAITVADTSKAEAQAFSLVAKPDTTYIAVGAASATPSAVFAPLEKLGASWTKGMGLTLVTALNPHPTKLMVYHTITNAWFSRMEDYDIQTVALIDMATSPPTATMHLHIKTSAAADIVVNRWYKLMPGPDGESVFLVGLVRGTTTLKYGRYVPGGALVVQSTPFADQPTSIAGIYAS